jgi:hypothetical protein
MAAFCIRRLVPRYIGECAVFHSLLSLEDEQISIVMDAVRQWCEQRDVSIESPAGRDALNAAIEAVRTARSTAGVFTAIETRLIDRALAA